MVKHSVVQPASISLKGYTGRLNKSGLPDGRTTAGKAFYASMKGRK